MKKSPNGEPLQYLLSVLESPPANCVEWKYGGSGRGYGILRFQGRKVVAHRLALRLYAGDPPSETLQAAHSCGNRACINPTHIRWATAKENSADRELHGTVARGTKNGGGKGLTIAEVLCIKADRGRRQVDIAREFGVSQSLVSHIQVGRAWSWVETDPEAVQRAIQAIPDELAMLPEITDFNALLERLDVVAGDIAKRVGR